MGVLAGFDLAWTAGYYSDGRAYYYNPASWFDVEAEIFGWDSFKHGFIRYSKIKRSRNVDRQALHAIVNQFMNMLQKITQGSVHGNEVVGYLMNNKVAGHTNYVNRRTSRNMEK